MNAAEQKQKMGRQQQHEKSGRQRLASKSHRLTMKLASALVAAALLGLALSAPVLQAKDEVLLLRTVLGKGFGGSKALRRSRALFLSSLPLLLNSLLFSVGCRRSVTRAC